MLIITSGIGLKKEINGPPILFAMYSISRVERVDKNCVR